VHHPARAVLAGLCAAAAAVATWSLTALAYDRTDHPDPIVAGHTYTYFVKEIDTDHQPIRGRRVIMTVLRGAGPDTAVAASDANGNTEDQPGPSASEVSGADGLVYFVLRTSSTPGENDYAWRDDTYSGLVVVVGKPSGVASPSASAGAGGAGGHRGGASGGGGGSGSKNVADFDRAALPPTSMPPLAAGMLAFLLVWLLVPPLLQRHVAFARRSALPGTRPAPVELG
jgi:hypothetical protein